MISLGAAAILAAALMTREVAVTFDDLPAFPPSLPVARQEILTRNLLHSIKAAGVPAVGFVNDKKLETNGRIDPRKVKLLQQWVDAGLELGNHTYSHADLHVMNVAEFEKDLVKGEQTTRALQKKLRWFRHPYLHTGRSLPTRTRIETLLRKRGVRVAPVTLDNSEWIFAQAYENADARTKARVGREYVAYMDRKLAYFEDQSDRLFRRNIRHVLLLHANALNADWFDEIAASMKKRGYSFITLERALEDPAYKSRDGYIGAGSPSWIHRWALTAKKPRTFFGRDPRTPRWVLDVAKISPQAE